MCNASYGLAVSFMTVKDEVAFRNGNTLASVIRRVRREVVESTARYSNGNKRKTDNYLLGNKNQKYSLQYRLSVVLKVNEVNISELTKGGSSYIGRDVENGIVVVDLR